MRWLGTKAMDFLIYLMSDKRAREEGTLMIKTTNGMPADQARANIERLRDLLGPDQLDRFRGIQATLFALNLHTPNREVPAADIAALAEYISTGSIQAVAEVTE